MMKIKEKQIVNEKLNAEEKEKDSLKIENSHLRTNLNEITEKYESLRC